MKPPKVPELNAVMTAMGAINSAGYAIYKHCSNKPHKNAILEELANAHDLLEHFSKFVREFEKEPLLWHEFKAKHKLEDL